MSRSYEVLAGVYRLEGKLYKQGDTIVVDAKVYAQKRKSIEAHVIYHDLRPNGPGMPKAKEPNPQYLPNKVNTSTGKKKSKNLDLSGLDEKSQARVEDYHDDIKDDGKRNRSNRKKKR